MGMPLRIMRFPGTLNLRFQDTSKEECKIVLNLQAVYKLYLFKLVCLIYIQIEQKVLSVHVLSVLRQGALM